MSKKLFSKVFVFLLVVGLLFAVSPTKQALAQTGPTMSIVPVGGTSYCGPEAGTTTIDVMVQDLPAEPKLQGYSVGLTLPTGVTITGAVKGDVLGGSLGITDPVIRNGNEVYAYAMGESQSTQAGTLVTITLSHPVALATLGIEFNANTILSGPDADVIPVATMTGTTINREIAIVQNTATSAYFCDLQEAVTAAAGGNTLNVLRNFAVDATVDITKQLTFNTAGYTVSFTPATGFYTPILWVKAGGNLTINGTGTLNSVTVAGNGAAVRVSEGGDLTLAGATLAGGYSSLRIDGNRAPGGDERPAIDSTFTMTSGTLADGFVIFGKGAEATINGGLVQSETEYAAITGNGINNTAENNSGTKITINGGEVQNFVDAAIFHPQDGDLIITGGQVWGATGIIMKSGNLDISGPSNIYADGAYAEPIVSGSGQNSTGDAILVYGGTGYTGDITVNIHNSEDAGQITSQFAYAIREFSNSTTDTRTSSIKISSGNIQALEVFDTPVKFTEQLRANALADEPNDTLLLTGGYYSGYTADIGEEWAAHLNPAYYVFPPLETYYVEYPYNIGYRIRTQLAVTNGDLKFNYTPTGTYTALDGNFTDGFVMYLDPSVEWYYLDTDSITSNYPLADGMYPFTVAGGDPDFPTFYLKVVGTEFTLIDGYKYWTPPSTETPLRIDGDFVPGTYTFTGTVTDTRGSSAPVSIKLTLIDALQLVVDDTTLTGTLDNLTATFPTAIPAVIDHEPYTINSRMTLSAPLPTGSKVTIEISLDGVTWVPYVTDATLPGTTFWITDLAGGTPAPFDGSTYNGRVEHYRITVTGNPVTVDTFLKVESIISKDGFATETVLAELANIPVLFVINLDVTDADLLASADNPAGTYIPLGGDFTSGFTMLLDPAVGYYYLDVDNFVVNNALEDGLYPFTIASHPATGFFEYWAAKGVVDGATGWQGQMWAIINGDAPLFYVKVAGSVYTLVDGLEYWIDPLTAGPAKINGSYFTGAYTFTGSLMDVYNTTDALTIGVTFYNTLNVTDADLLAATAAIGPYTPLTGDLTHGFTMELNPAVPYYYLDVDAFVANNTLKDGMYPFLLTGHPALGFFEYWAAKGVVAGATGWQGQMWKIINGTAPVFYVKVAGSDYTLVDGLEYWLNPETAGPAKINGEYLSGAYTFSGSLTDIFNTTDSQAIVVTFTRANIDSVTGTIGMQGRTTRAGVLVKLTGNFGYGPYTDTSEELVSNNFNFTNVGLGEYLFTTVQPRYLNLVIATNKIIMIDQVMALDPLQLRGGNAVWMNSTTEFNSVINGGDASLVGTQYGTAGADAGFGNHGDCNFDGIVNIQDLALVGGNFDLTSAVAYAGWMEQ